MGLYTLPKCLDTHFYFYLGTSRHGLGNYECQNSEGCYFAVHWSMVLSVSNILSFSENYSI